MRKDEKYVSDKIKKLYKLKKKCPSCEKKIKKPGGFSVYETSLFQNIEYLLCELCFASLVNANKEGRDSLTQKIEYNLDTKLNEFAAINVRLEQMKKNKEELEKIINRYGQDLHIDAEWNVKDREFFNNNPERIYYARGLYEDEFETITGDQNPEIKFALIKKITNEQRSKMFFTDLSHLDLDDEILLESLCEIVEEEYDINYLDELYRQKLKASNE
jgi:hypothetical protein